MSEYDPTTHDAHTDWHRRDRAELTIHRDAGADRTSLTTRRAHVRLVGPSASTVDKTVANQWKPRTALIKRRRGCGDHPCNTPRNRLKMIMMDRPSIVAFPSWPADTPLRSAFCRPPYGQVRDLCRSATGWHVEHRRATGAANRRAL